MERILKRDVNTLFELTRREIKKQYRGSVLGFFWTMLNPLLTMLVMWLIFSQIFGQGDPYYPIYLLTGNILFSALRSSTTQSLTSFQNNRGILLRTKIPPYVFPCSITFSSIINFVFSLIALIPFMIWLSIQQGVNLFSYRLFFILLMLPAFWMFVYGLGLLFGITYIFFRDILHIYTVFMVLWQYLTPVFYKANNLGDLATNIIRFNPMYHFVAYFRECVYMGVVGCDSMTGALDLKPYLPEFSKLGYIYAFGTVSIIIGLVAYNSLKQKTLMKL